MTVTDAVRVADRPAPPVRRHRRRITAIALALVLAGAVTLIGIGWHYDHSTPLTCACAVAWGPQEHVRTVDVGGQSSTVAAVRLGQAQSYYVLVANSSPVTQRIVGPDSYLRDTAEPIDFAVALPTGSLLHDQDEVGTQHFTTRPVDVAPGGLRWVRFTVHTAAASVRLWGPGRQEFWTFVQLRVQVGMFIRTERITLNQQMVLEMR